MSKRIKKNQAQTYLDDKEFQDLKQWVMKKSFDSMASYLRALIRTDMYGKKQK